MNTTPKQSPEFGIYTISKKYLAYIRQVDPNVVDPEITNTYVGPLCRMNNKRGPADMFAPIDVAKYNSQKYFLANCYNGVYAGIIDLYRMVPCLPTEYKLDETNEKLKNFVCGDEQLLKDCAQKILDEYNSQK